MRLNIFSRLSRRERLIFYLTVIIVFAIFFDKIVIQPVMDKLNELNKEILIQEKKLENALHTLSEEDLIIAEHKKIIQGVKQEGSDEEEVAELLSEIEKVAGKTDVFLSNVKPRLTEKDKHYKKYIIEIELESDITSLVDFIYQLEKSPCLLRVRDFYLVPKKEGSKILKVRMTITEVLIVS